VAFVAAFLLLGAYGVVALRGPQGIPALLEKQQEIRRLQETNTDLQREIQRKKERIERLKHSPSEQQMEIRKQLKLLRPNETEFVLPEAPATK
jgi:cell division protein FtsB